MKQDKVGWLSPQRRKETVEGIIGYFESERDEKIGVIAAEELLDMVLEQVGPDLFNKGVDEAKKVIEESYQTVSLDLGVLRKESVTEGTGQR